MRTTLDLDDDVLQALKELAQFRGQTAGKVASELVRKALLPSGPRPKVRNGVPILRGRPGQRLLTMADVNRIRDEE